MTGKPLLLLDVDGPLNPYAANPNRRPAGYQTHRMRPSGWDQPWQKPLRVWLNPEHGASLLALPFELVWATTWEAEANEWIGPHIGLPSLPHVAWGPHRLPSRSDGTYFKTHDIVTYAAGRPFAWVDDEIATQDREYVAANHKGPAMLHQVSPRFGLLPADFEALAEWAILTMTETAAEAGKG